MFQEGVSEFLYRGIVGVVELFRQLWHQLITVKADPEPLGNSLLFLKAM